MSSASLHLAAPAKINLFLRITGRRPDGRHALQTGFQFIDLCDTLELSCGREQRLQLYCDAENLPAEDNLVLCAARLLRAACGTSRGAELRLHKRIPVGGGLGGGSSDAAAVLVGLNHLWSLGLSRRQLAQLGLQLGADVPLFVHGRAAWAEGAGELLYPLDFPERQLLVLAPGAVSTAEIFASPGLTRDSKPIKITVPTGGDARNDCEQTVCERHPEVAGALAWLRQFGDASLTGTGGCVFASFTGPAEADALLRRLPSKWRGYRVRSLNRSPLWQGMPGH